MNNQKITFSLVQHPSFKGDINRNLNSYIENIKLSADSGADIVLFPELSLVGYELELASDLAINETSLIISSLSAAAVAHNVIVISGIPLKSETNKPYIGAVISFPSGETDFYRKQYLHPGEDRFITSGTQNFLFEFKQKNIFLGICADFANSKHWLDAKEANADIYLLSVLISKNGFAHDSEILRLKAIEHKLNIVMANFIGETGGWLSHGNSRAWDSDGNVCISANDSEPCLVICTVGDDGISGRIINITDNCCGTVTLPHN